MTFSALIAVLFTMIGQSDEQTRSMPSDKWLVIELPDGVRGGRGRIQGQGSREAFADGDYFATLLNVASKCRAVFPVVTNNVSHRTYLISWSSPNDLKVVDCLKANLPYHFNAGISDPNPFSLAGADSSLFRALETKLNTSTEQAH